MLGRKANIRCGNKYYTFAVRESRMGKSYLELTEVRMNGLSPLSKQTLYIFPEHATKFGAVLNMMLGSLEETTQQDTSPVHSPSTETCCYKPL